MLYGSLPKVLELPNGMDFSTATPAGPDKRQSLRRQLGVSLPIAVFVGSNHGPNNQALTALCEIAKQCPDTAFFIVGTVCDSMAGRAVPKNMRLLGALSEPEKTVVFQSAHVALNPVCQGGGSNVKLIEYMAFCLPVLSTPCGVRGFAMEAEKHLWIRELEEFAQALHEMTTQERQAEMQAMAHAAREHARALYDWPVICEPLLEQLTAGDSHKTA